MKLASWSWPRDTWAMPVVYGLSGLAGTGVKGWVQMWSWRVMLAIGVLSLLAACNGENEAAEGPVAWRAFDDGPFHVQLPDWESVNPTEEAELIQLRRRDRAVTVSRQSGVPRLVGEYVAEILPQTGDFQSVELLESRVDRVVLQAQGLEKPQLKLRMVFVYCGGNTYFLNAAAPISKWDGMRRLQQEAVASVQCDAAQPMAEPHDGMTGLIVSAAGEEFSFLGYQRAAALARSAGIEAAHVYVPWGEVETAPGQYDWTLTDLVLDTLSLEGLRLSAVIEYIHTSVRGPTPEDIADLPFDDPTYVERASDFAVAVAERYGDQIDYLALGNEVNIYFNEQPEDLDPYLQAFRQIRIAATGARLDLPIGTTIAFHEIQSANRFDLLHAFLLGDFLAYTYYPHDPGFRYDVPTDRFGAALTEMVAASGDTPFIIVENGFSSSERLGSDEARQAEYVRRSMEAWLEQGSPSRQIWVGLHDPPGDCQEAALSFFPEGFDSSSAGQEAWQVFREYLCTLGFRQADGTPKEAWGALTEYLTPPE